MGSAYLALHTVSCRSHATHGGWPRRRLGPETSVDKVLLATAEQQLYDTARDLLPGVVELTEIAVADGVPVLAGGDHLRRHRRDPAQHHRPPRSSAWGKE